MAPMKSPVSPRIRPRQHAEFEPSGLGIRAMGLAALVLALALTGCATATFAPLPGGAVPGTPGSRAMMNSCLRLPIYSGPPNRPYEIMGIVHCASGANPMQAARAAVREGAEHGAEALVLMNEYVKIAGVKTPGATFGLWNAYSRDISVEWPCRDAGVPPLWRAYVDCLPAIYESEYLFAAIHWR
jgi:hypothetical protein